MAKANAVIPGSRSLEFFVSGSCTPTSDWDVHVPNERTCVGIMLETMAKSGVQWQEAMQPLRDLAASAVRSVVFWEKEFLEKLLFWCILTKFAGLDARARTTVCVIVIAFVQDQPCRRITVGNAGLVLTSKSNSIHVHRDRY
jgi:hypothetical protein